MFPLRTALLEYLKDFQEKHQLNVQFNTDVRDIAENTKQAGEYKVSLGDQNGNTYKCKYELNSTLYTSHMVIFTAPLTFKEVTCT